jgi:hypothetical protein
VALVWTTVSFLTKICTEVPSLSLDKTKVPFAIKNEPNRVKNKRVKPHEVFSI